MPILKTPLRYPGGKSRAMKTIGKHIPRNIKRFHDPFLGGGSIALWVTQNIPDAEVWVNDVYVNLFFFWSQLRDNPTTLVDNLFSIKDEIKDDPERGREKFYDIKEKNNTETKETRAAYFFALNKMSFSGLGESSGFSSMALKSNFNYRSIEILPEYSTLIQKWTITCLDYTWLLDDNPDTLVVLDPPYEIPSFLYGKGGNHHRGFDHDEFAKRCNRAKSKQLITYNSDYAIKERFDGWKQIEWDLTYTMRSDEKYTKEQKNRKELILKNY